MLILWRWPFQFGIIRSKGQVNVSIKVAVGQKNGVLRLVNVRLSRVVELACGFSGIKNDPKSLKQMDPG